MGAGFISCLIEIARVCSRSGWEGASVVTDSYCSQQLNDKSGNVWHMWLTASIWVLVVQLVHDAKSFLQAKDIQRSGQESNQKNLKDPQKHHETSWTSDELLMSHESGWICSHLLDWFGGLACKWQEVPTVPTLQNFLASMSGAWKAGFERERRGQVSEG
jgi:hypothetical protein